MSGDKIRGTIQNDILKEYVARGTYIYPPRPSMRLIVDIFAYCAERAAQLEHHLDLGLPHPRGRLDRGPGDRLHPGQRHRLRGGGHRGGHGRRRLRPALSFFWNAHNNLFEEVAKFRAARRMWARIMTERFGAKDERSKMLRFHTQTGGSTLTAQQPENNIVRVTLQAWPPPWAAPRACTPTASTRRSACPPTRAAKIALRTQQIVGFESGVADTVDPLAGSYFVESLTDEVEAAANAYLGRIEELGGAVAAIEARFMQEEIEAAAYSYAKAIDDGEKVVVGVNKFTDDRRRATPRCSRSTSSSSSSRSSGRKPCAPPGTRVRSTARWPTWPRRPAETGNLLVPMKVGPASRWPRWARSPTSCGTSSACTSPAAEAWPGGTWTRRAPREGPDHLLAPLRPRGAHARSGAAPSPGGGVPGAGRPDRRRGPRSRPHALLRAVDRRGAGSAGPGQCPVVVEPSRQLVRREVGVHRGRLRRRRTHRHAGPRSTSTSGRRARRSRRAPGWDWPTRARDWGARCAKRCSTSPSPASRPRRH